MDAKQQYEKQIKHDVAEHGWHVCIVAEDEVGPGFAYSIGIEETYDHPEVIVFGLDPGILGGTMHQLVNVIGELIKGGGQFRDGSLVDDVLEGVPCAFREIPRHEYANYFGCGRWYHGGDEFRALQIVWPDSTGLFPWDEGYNDSWRDAQPLLGHAA